MASATVLISSCASTLSRAAPRISSVSASITNFITPRVSSTMYARGMAMISATGWPAPPHSQQHHQHRATATGHQCGAVGCSVRLAQRSAGDEGRPIAIAGELLADEMVTGDRSPLLAAFRPGRFR
jgi:hypothetical protein